MSRSLTSQELAVYRSDGLATKLYVIIDQPAVVYSARVNQTFSTHDRIAQVNYNNASGNLAHVLPGMTVLVGVTPGGWERGIARVRKAWTSSIAYIGETSEILWENGLYLTVIDEFAIWPRHVRIVGNNVVYMDYDIAYSDQHNLFEPILVMGSDRVIRLDGSSLSVQLDASQSWVIGSTIAQYSWSVISGSGTIIDANTATPTLQTSNTGRIVVRCTVTAANGKSSSGYRSIYVYNENSTMVHQVDLEHFSGGLDEGGFEFSVRLITPLQSQPRNYLKAILFSEDFPQAIGDNVLAVGWMDEQECTVDENGGMSILSIKGGQHWLKLCAGYPVGVENVNRTPAAWTEMQNLTVDKALFHLLYWRTTLPNCVDILLSGDGRIAPAFHALGNVWEQIRMIAEESILANVCCDACSRLFVQIHPNLLPAVERNVPVVLELSKDDFHTIDIQSMNHEIHQYNVSGIDQNQKPVLATAPGLVYGRYGKIGSKEQLLFSNQQQANQIAGLLLAREQREFDFSIHLTGVIRLFQIVPFAFIQMNVTAADTPAQIRYAGNVIPYRVEYTFENGVLNQTIFAEPETFAAPSVPQYYSATPIVGTPEIPLPELDSPQWPSLLPGRFAPPLLPGDDPLPPEYGATCPTSAPANGPFIWNVPYTMISNSTYVIHIPARLVIRSSGHDNLTVWGLRGRFLKLDNDVWQETNENNFYNVYAYNAAGQIVATGNKDAVSDLRYRTGTFTPPAATEIAYIGIAIEADLLRPTTIYPEVEAGHFWDDWGREHGELSWGYLGAGLWAFIKNAKLTYNYSWFVISKLRLGGFNEYLNVPFIIKQKVHASQNKGNILWAQGQLRSDALGWTELWFDDFPDGLVTPPYLWFVPKESQALGRSYTHIAVSFEIRPSGQTQIIMDHYIEIWRKARYRIELQSFEFWNVCPRPEE